MAEKRKLRKEIAHNQRKTLIYFVVAISVMVLGWLIPLAISLWK